MKYLVYILTLLICLSANSQSVAELGLMGGGSYYIGDLNPTKHFNNTKFSAGLIYRSTNKNDRVAFRMHFFYGSVEASDANSSDPNIQKRNLAFKSSIIEIGPLIEINFVEYEIGSKKKPATPYLFGGITYFRMNPKGMYNNEWTELQPLATEGQETSQNSNSRYKLNQISLPVGMGVKVNLSTRLAFNVEYGIRKTFTDYLDDVSGSYVDPILLSNEAGQLSATMSDPSLSSDGDQVRVGEDRGNSFTKDWYSFFGVGLSFRLQAYTTCMKKWK